MNRTISKCAPSIRSNQEDYKDIDLDAIYQLQVFAYHIFDKAKLLNQVIVYDGVLDKWDLEQIQNVLGNSGSRLFERLTYTREVVKRLLAAMPDSAPMTVGDSILKGLAP